MVPQFTAQMEKFLIIFPFRFISFTLFYFIYSQPFVLFVHFRDFVLCCFYFVGVS